MDTIIRVEYYIFQKRNLLRCRKVATRRYATSTTCFPTYCGHILSKMMNCVSLLFFLKKNEKRKRKRNGREKIIKWGKKWEEEEKIIYVEGAYGLARGPKKVEDFLNNQWSFEIYLIRGGGGFF